MIPSLEMPKGLGNFG